MQHIFKPILLFAIISIILLSGCQKQSTFNIQNTDKPKQLIKKLEATTPITTVRFNPQHPTQVALGLQNGLVHFWDFAENKLSTLTAHKHLLIDVAFSSDGSLLATGGYDDRIVRIWNIHKMQEIQSFSLHDRIMKVAFSPDGTHLAVAVFADKEASNNIIVIWDIQQQKIVKRLKKHKQAISSIVFSQDNQWLASGSFDGSVNLWHWKTGNIEKTFQHSLPITSLDYTTDKQLLAIGLQDGRVQFLEINTEKLTHVIKHDSWTSQLIFFQNGKRLISSSFQNKVTIQKLPEQTIEKEINIYQTITRVDLNKTEDRIAVSLMDGTVRIYDLQGQLQDLLVMSATAKEWLSCDYNQQTCLKTNPPVDFLTLLKNFYSLFFLLASILIAVSLWFYVRIYKHPITLQLSANPKELLKLPLQQLPEAKRLLEITGRLNTILGKCDISPKTFEQAITFLNARPKEQANILVQRLMSVIESEKLPVFLIKLRSFRLNLDNCLFYFPEKHLVASDILHKLEYEDIFHTKKVIIITLELDKQQSLRFYGKDRRNEWIVPDEVELTKWLLSATPIETFSRILSNQLNLAKISPYQMSGGLSKEESFFGRTNILSDILSRQLRNYLIIGGREIGKTSLLNYLKSQYEKRADLEIHYHLCIYNTDIFQELANLLNLKNADRNFEQISNYLDNSDKVHIFLVDEIDVVIKSEKQPDYLNLQKLRSLSTNSKCYFILTGVWHLYESALLEYYSPLRNFGEIIILGELEYEACQDLIVKPLDALNISINEQLTKYIIEQTGQRANLIARICHLLVSNLNNTTPVIDNTMLDKVLQDDKLQDTVSNWVGIAPSSDEKVLDKMIVYTTVQQGRFTLQTVLDNLKAYQFPHNRDNVKTELDRLSLEFVFKKVEHGQYIYAVPLLRENLLQENIEMLILELDI